MIPCSLPDLESEGQRSARPTFFHDPRDLLNFLDLDALWNEQKQQVCAEFPFRVSRHFAGLMEKGNPDDPLLRQVLPSSRELHSDSRFSQDPVQDSRFHQGNGMLRKYNGRALLITTAACPVNCRYCFRRHFPYQEQQSTPARWNQIAKQLNKLTDIREVILSGGDPLSLSNRRMATLIQILEQSRHIHSLRIHTRTPVMLPDRIDDELINILRKSRFNIVLVTHINHAREISSQLKNAMQALRNANITLLNQSVLLNGVNDSPDTLVELSETLFLAGILPYYLHQLDKVEGAMHFYVGEVRALEIESELLSRLPGYLVPKLVVERPGADSKLPLSSVTDQ